jgi:AcrR family transcriptional regulator
MSKPGRDALVEGSQSAPRRATPKRRTVPAKTRDLAAEALESRDDGSRRSEILQAAAALIASSGRRTSLYEIADAAGIMPGSLYHHFESKEAILVELIRRYHDDLDRIGDLALGRLDEGGSRPVSDQIFELAAAIAKCAVKHHAAFQMSFYEGPSADPELVKLSQWRPSAIEEAMLQTLRAGRWSGYIRPDIDLQVLADRICQTMLRVGIDVIRHNAPPERVAALLCRIILHGLANRAVGDAELDRSRAFAAANDVILSWSDDDADRRDKAARLRTAAKMEFGRKGYEVTTIRDIATAAGMDIRAVYRLIGSKNELLESIMRSFGDKLAAGWISVLGSAAAPTEKLDALSWLNTNVLDQFGDEFRIQLAWLRQSPPNSPNDLAALFTTRMKQMKSLLSEGMRSGELAIDCPSTAMLARCVVTIQWIPEDILHATGKRASLIHVRDTLLRGVTTRP